jgi:hypothetical protein
MPSDFFKLDKITFENFENKEFSNRFNDFYWENQKTLMIKYNYKGLIKIKYWSLPTTIESDNSSPELYDNVELEVLENAQETMIYGIAGNLLITENDKRGLATQFINLYEQQKYNLQGIDKTNERTRIKNIWGRCK